MNDSPGENPGVGRPRRAPRQGRPSRKPLGRRISSSPDVSPADRVSVSLTASRTDDAPNEQKAESGACGLPSPSEGQATGILWLGPTTPVYLCDDHLNEFAHLRFVLEEEATPEEVGDVRPAAYGRLLEERPECVECATSGTVLRWYDE